MTEPTRGDERLRFLAEASLALDSSLDHTATLERVARLVVPRLADWCQVDLFDDASFRTVAIAHVDPERERLALALRRGRAPTSRDPDSIHEVQRTGQPMLQSVLDSPGDGPDARLLDLLGTRSLARLPLRARDRVLGVISLGSATSAAFTDDDLPFFDELARRAALAVDNARLYSALQATEQRYRGLFEAADDAILILDLEGRIVEANAAAEELLGRGRDELRVLRLGDLIARAGWVERELARLRAEGRWQGEMDVHRRDGALVPVEGRARLIATSGGQLALAALRDISERRAAEQSQREFVAMIGHELRNPLASLRGYAQLLARRKVYNEAAVEVIVQQVDRLNRLIGDLVDASRLERGRLELFRAPVDLLAIAGHAVESARGFTDRHTIRVEAPSSPPLGQWDHDRIGQVLQNLLSNAIKYSPPGEIVLRIEHDDDRARVSVIDRGPGVPAQDLPRLFQRFHRSEQAAASDAAGLGLGLYISRGLVESHGGRIWVEPTPGGGATFVFDLPYGESQGE